MCYIRYSYRLRQIGGDKMDPLITIVTGVLVNVISYCIICHRKSQSGFHFNWLYYGISSTTVQSAPAA